MRTAQAASDAKICTILNSVINLSYLNIAVTLRDYNGNRCHLDCTLFSWKYIDSVFVENTYDTKIKHDISQTGC